MPLVEAAIQQDALAINLDKVLGSGGGAGGTVEGDFHRGRGRSLPSDKEIPLPLQTKTLFSDANRVKVTREPRPWHWNGEVE